MFTLVFVVDADRLYQTYEKDIISIIDGRKLKINSKKISWKAIINKTWIQMIEDKENKPHFLKNGQI